MSTRRARIKAVASLPVRRKNQETKDSAKSRPSTPKQLVEKQENVPTTTEEPTKIDETPTETDNDAKFHQTPKRGRRSSIHTPNLIERARTPRSKDQILSPHRKLSPAVQYIASPLAHRHNEKQVPAVIRSSDTSSTVIKSAEVKKPNETTSGKDSSALDGISSIQDYNPPSIPESTTEETVLDGIVPLHSNRSVPKPLDLLKNEIISENAEVLFDPIVPLPSPSKVRPKLRPAPRLAFRRNSIQGSASESEDESRRALLNAGATTPAPPRQRHDSHTSHSTQYTLPNRDVNRVRNDSICSSVSQIAQPLSQPSSVPPSSVPKEKHVSKSRRTEASRRMSALRRRQRGRENVPRDTLTMYDLIFFNPTTNPIVPEPEETTVIKPAESQAEPTPSKEPEADAEDEGKADDPPEQEDSAPVPQIKLGPNGEIILDEKSLVIEQTGGPRKLSSSVVHETDWATSGRGKYTRSKRTADWSDAETVRFYRALAAVGTDFTLMSPLFPDRTRKDLKLKFKKEERQNGGQVDKALRSQTQWDATRLVEEFAEERRAAAEKAAKLRAAYLEQKRAEKQRAKTNRHEGFRHSRGAKAIEFNMDRGVTSGAGSADDLIEKAIQEKLETQKLKEARSKAKKLAPPKATPKRPIPLLLPINTEYATLTLANAASNPRLTPKQTNATNAVFNPRVTPQQTNARLKQLLERQTTPVVPVALGGFGNVPNVPENIESGSLVVVTVDDPNEPSKKMLQTYISHGAGKLTPVALPPTLLNSVITYMKKGTPKSGMSSSSSPQLMSPSSVASQESRSSVIQINPSPSKRARHSSFTITQL